MLRRHFITALLGQFLARSSLVRADIAAPLTSVAFGSCNRTHLPQPLWGHILERKPDLFLWLGDVVYADTIDPEEMRLEYQRQLLKPGYAELSQSIPVLGIWDDHDYGGNNLGKENPIKVQSQQLFLDFLGEPSASARRKQKGIFASYVYGTGGQQIKLLLLDTRYHRERPGRGRADLLGADQWQWLESELQNSTASVHVIASSYSVLSTQVPRAEEWQDFRWAKKRLFHLLRKHRVRGVLFLTGDRHFAAFLTENISGRIYHEIMSSGMTHYLTRPRISRLLRNYYGAKNSFFGINFGMLEFDWGDPVRLRVGVYDNNNQLRLEKRLRLIDGLWVS